MKPEDLKQLAEYMGYGVDVRPFDETVYIYNKQKDEKLHYKLHKEYNPLTNAEQCLELMEKFKSQTQWSEPLQEWYVLDSYGGIGEGKTINEAVTNAAIAAIKE